MKIIFNQLIALLLILPTILPFGFAQNELHFEVNRVYPSLSISKEKLADAETLIDLNRHYKASWVRSYISVEIKTLHNGTLRKALSKDNRLSSEQKTNMNQADAGTAIVVRVDYLPENTLKQNDSKEIKFEFSVEPETSAKYAGGLVQLNQYLQKNAIDEIPEGSYQNYDLSTIKFTIDETGAVVDAHVFGAFYREPEFEQLDNFLLEVIKEMPDWQPAIYANGKKIKQDFVLTVGNHENCVMNLLNIHQYGLAPED